ncbi:hypothetical protein [Limimaricola sp.]|uniref:hypothetical protein n=1 Tax=Limimaricola sp. TaxID=2211665 RepID=UPI004058BBA2
MPTKSARANDRPRPMQRRGSVIVLALALLPLSIGIAIWITHSTGISLLWLLPIQGLTGAMLTMAVVFARYLDRR